MMTSRLPFIWSTVNDSVDELATGIHLAVENGAKSIILLTCSDNHYPLDAINSVLQQCPVNICGGIFPNIVVGNHIFEQGAVVVGLSLATDVINYTELSQQAQHHFQETALHTHRTTTNPQFLMFADALCSANESFIEYFYESIGNGITVIGGGAGFLDFVQRPCLFTNEGLIEDAVQVVSLHGELSRSIGHGWEVIDGPYLVTAADGHRLSTLNYESAFKVYQETIERLSGQIITADNFFSIAKNFPLGIVDLNGDVLVRDPITTDLQSLECVGNIPPNTTINLLKGEPEKLIDSSKQVASKLNTDNSQLLLLFDCISRILYLEKEFVDELNALQQANSTLPMIGALSLGEITNTERGALHLLNKSTVIGALGG